MYWIPINLGWLIFQCHIFLPFHIVHGTLKPRILEWFPVPFSSGLHLTSKYLGIFKTYVSHWFFWQRIYLIWFQFFKMFKAYLRTWDVVCIFLVNQLPYHYVTPCLWEFSLPSGSVVKNPPAMQEPRFDPWVGRILWKRKWQPTPVFLFGKTHGQRSLAGYSPRGHKRIGHDLLTKQNIVFFIWI